jgi:hypothetical protein
MTNVIQSSLFKLLSETVRKSINSLKCSRNNCIQNRLYSLDTVLVIFVTFHRFNTQNFSDFVWICKYVNMWRLSRYCSIFENRKTHSSHSRNCTSGCCYSSLNIISLTSSSTQKIFVVYSSDGNWNILILLQAPVSDREYLTTFPEVVSNLQLAQQMIKEGKSHYFMPPMQVFPHQALTVYRLE